MMPVEDRLSFREVLGDEPGLRVVAQTGSPEARAYLAALTFPTDVAKVDLGPPVGDRTAPIPAGWSDAKVSVLTASVCLEGASRVFEVGASAVPRKPGGYDEVLEGVRTLPESGSRPPLGDSLSLVRPDATREDPRSGDRLLGLDK